jgi:hypothetical protein
MELSVTQKAIMLVVGSSLSVSQCCCQSEQGNSTYT